MSYGNLTVICGPMYGGKTTELLKRVLWARNGLGKSVMVVKPAFDDRYSETKIVSHDGLSVDALSIRQWSDTEKFCEYSEMVCLDEVQFFTEFDIIQIVYDLLAEGKDVVANGLDMDINGKAFPITANLMAMADEIVKVRSNCSVCGSGATKTKKIGGSDAQVELGSIGMYEPRCNRHWMD